MKLIPIVHTSAIAGDASSNAAAIAGKQRHGEVANALTPDADPQALQCLAEQLNQNIGMTGQQVQFSVDHDTGKTVLRVTDAESGALLRQIPGDEALAMARILDRMQGVLIRQKA